MGHSNMHPAPASDTERGFALVLALIFTIVVIGVTVTGSLSLRSVKTATETSFVQHAQAAQLATSGLAEALAWFRKQTSQPVRTFAPVQDLLSDPPILETDFPDIGIAREWKITGAIWGRYEVWKEWTTDPDPERSAWRDQMFAEDVSSQRGAVGEGAAWRLRSIGYVFRRIDPGRRFDEYPNQVVGQQIFEMEIGRLALRPPGQAALSVLDGNSCHINTKGRVLGGASGAGVFYPAGTGTPTTGPPNPPRVTGTPALAPSATFYGSVEDVFGVTLAQLKAMADETITVAADFPSPIAKNSIVVGEAATFSFDSTRPLSGTGIVYLRGNVTLLPGSNSAFNGLLYVDGNLTVRAPSEILGAVVVTGNVTVQGASDFATIAYDDEILNALRRDIGQYRRTTAITRPLNPNK